MKKLFILGISLLSLKFPHNGYCAAAAAAASSAESVEEISVEEPYRIIGLETELKKHGITGDKPYLLPSHFSEILQKAQNLRFSPIFSEIPGAIPPHPRGFVLMRAQFFHPESYVTALAQHLFPAAAPGLFIPNTLRDDPISSLSADKLGKLIKAIEEAKTTYRTLNPIEWRKETQSQIETVLGTKNANKIKDVDRDQFIKYSTAKGIVSTLKLYIEGVDLRNPELAIEIRDALSSAEPYSNIMKIIAPGYFKDGYFEQGFLESIKNLEEPYSSKQKYALRKEIFIDIIVGAIEDDMLRSDKQPSAQDLLTVFFHRKFAGNRKAIEEFYAGYLGIERVEFPSLKFPRVFGYEEYKEFQKSGDVRGYLSLPADTRASIAFFEKEQGEYHPTSYSSVVTKPGESFPNCVEESLVNVLFFLMRQRPDDLIVYDASVFPEESPARNFMDKWGAEYRNGAAQARIDFSEVLSIAEGIVFKKSGKYEIRSGLISGLNALLYMLGGDSVLDFSNYESEFHTTVGKIKKILPDDLNLELLDSYVKNILVKDFFGDIYVQNGIGEVLIWRLQQGHSLVEALSRTGKNWVDDLLGSDLTTDEARMLVPLISDIERFNLLLPKLDLHYQSCLYRSMNLQDPEIVIAIIESISRNMLEGGTEDLKFMNSLSSNLIELDDDNAYADVYRALTPVVLDKEIDDKDRITIIKNFPYILTGDPLYFRRCEVLDWACKNNRGDLFSVLSTENLEKYELNLNKGVIINYPDFLAENIGKLVSIGRVSISIIGDIEDSQMQKVIEALPSGIKTLQLDMTLVSAVNFVLSVMPDEMESLRRLVVTVSRYQPFPERLALMQSISTKYPDCEIDYEGSFNRREIGEGLDLRSPVPRARPQEPYDDYAGGAAAAAAAGI